MYIYIYIYISKYDNQLSLAFLLLIKFTKYSSPFVPEGRVKKLKKNKITVLFLFYINNDMHMEVPPYLQSRHFKAQFLLYLARDKRDDPQQC